MRTQLPPLAAIRAFEAAARRTSFTRAAEELGMTQAAISYQIRILEDRVGAPLFRRLSRGVELTDVGIRLSRQTSEALDLLRDAFANAKELAQETLVLSVIPTFATNFLAQRLGRFQIAHQDIAVRVEVSQTIVDLSREDFDISIRSGNGDWPGMMCHKLMDAVFTPMLSRELAQQNGGITSPADLTRLPIIEPSDPWWRLWFETAGISADLANTTLAKGPNLQFGSQVLEANAAMAGQGVGILTPFFYRDALDQGRLYQPFDLTCSDGKGYWLVYPESRRNAPSIKAFRDWIMAEMKLST